ncbi:LysM peptidoglycan-binding domain-containing protein [Gardnerella greenwoodii]|uniref:LysM peptidoglycan-binding domain-containing protein n=1 Tax=Gardnerella greenwoodii TaxID=2914925 RepID=UPI0039EE48C1
MNTASRNDNRISTRSKRIATTAVSCSKRASAMRIRRNRVLRIIVLLMSIAVFCAVFMPKTAVSAVPEKFITYTVRPGDTLWSYASTITPKNGDIADSVERLISLNHLPSADLEVGQSINVPSVSSNQ